MGMLVLDVETGIDAVSDDARVIAIGRRRRGAGDATRKEQSDATGTAQIQILSNDGLEEMTTLNRTVEDLRAADFQLAQRDAVIKARGAIFGAQRPREAMRPPIEEGLNVARAECITGCLQSVWIGTREKAVVQTLESDSSPMQLLLDPLVPIQTDLKVVRDVGPDLDECRPPRIVVDVEVVVIDGDRLSGEVERHAALRPTPFVGLERARFLLRDANDHDAFARRELRAIRRDDRVFVLARLE